MGGPGAAGGGDVAPLEARRRGEAPPGRFSAALPLGWGGGDGPGHSPPPPPNRGGGPVALRAGRPAPPGPSPSTPPPAGGSPFVPLPR